MKATQPIEILAPRSIVYDVISDFRRYPEFLSHVTKVTVEEAHRGAQRVGISVSFMQEVQFVIEATLDQPNGLSWTYVEGDLRDNCGRWEIDEVTPQLTMATFSCAVDFHAAIPCDVSQTLVQFAMPQMLKHFKGRAERMALDSSVRSSSKHRV